jgi:hypothetical protein
MKFKIKEYYKQHSTTIHKLWYDIDYFLNSTEKKVRGDLSLCWSGTLWGPLLRTLKILITPILPPMVNFEGTIVFLTPQKVYTDIHMVGVPYFLEELRHEQV